MLRRRLALALFALACAATSALALSGSRVYKNPQLRVRAFEVPRGWTIAPQVGYPRLLVVATSTDGGRMNLAFQPVGRGATAELIARPAAQTLARQGFGDVRLTADGDRVRLEATRDHGRITLRQVYLVDGDLGFVVTVAAPTAKAPRALKDFDEAVSSLTIDPLPPPEAAFDGGQPDAR